jgi:cobalamin-dependent methionine synthase I
MASKEAVHLDDVFQFIEALAEVQPHDPRVHATAGVSNVNFGIGTRTACSRGAHMMLRPMPVLRMAAVT